MAPHLLAPIVSPQEYGPHTTVYNRFNRWSGRRIWQQTFETACRQVMPPVGDDSDARQRRGGLAGGAGPIGARQARMSKRTAAPAAGRGASEQAIGVNKRGRNSKIHALTAR